MKKPKKNQGVEPAGRKVVNYAGVVADIRDAIASSLASHTVAQSDEMGGRAIDRAVSKLIATELAWQVENIELFIEQRSTWRAARKANRGKAER